MTARRLPAPLQSAAVVIRGACAIALVLVLAACGLFGAPNQNQDTKNSGSSAQAEPSIAATVPDELRSFYAQEVSWASCEREFQCAKIKVPVDYANPAGDSIEIA